MTPPDPNGAPGAPGRPAWHALAQKEVLERLGATEEGLSTAEAGERLKIHGPNVIQRARREGPLVLIWRQVNSPLIWVLLASGALALAMARFTDGAVVLGVVAVNTLIGFLQEHRAGQAIESLSRMIPEFATARRDREWQSLPVADLTLGDLVMLQAGDKVPADLRLLSVKNLFADESALTGESLPVAKSTSPVEEKAVVGDRKGLVHGGTLVTSGTALGLVVAVGAATELGRISSLLKETTQLETPLTRQLAQVSRWLTTGIVVVTAVLFGVGLFRGYDLVDATLAAISLAVAAIPEGLPAIITIALAIGVRRMAQRRTVIRRLSAVETLGSTTVICSDKTGTLTKNEMTVSELWTPEGDFGLTGVGYAPEGGLVRDGRAVAEPPESVLNLLRAGVLCNDAALRQDDGRWGVTGDPTEAALVVAGRKLGLNETRARAAWPRLDALPFDSETKFMATLHQAEDGRRTAILKGAAEVILGRCVRTAGGEPLDRPQITAAVDRMAKKGRRVLALAVLEADSGLNHLDPAGLESGLTLLGLQGMIDPPRPEAIAAIRACHRAGVLVKMITGDYPVTALAIAADLGVARSGRAVTGAELAAQPPEGFSRLAQEADVFARVAPEHKLRLVEALQAAGQVVAMTGDGVNDAPALKRADIGVAMGRGGTSVAREAAAAVLTDDNFASIVAAVEEGRRVYDNLLKSLAFVLPTNLGEALIVMVAVLFFPLAGEDPLMPILPVQILWVNLVATVALALPLAFEAKEPGLMDRPPRKPGAPVFSPFLIGRTVVVTLLLTLSAVGIFLWEYDLARGRVDGPALSEAQTMAVTAIVFFQIFYLLNCRSLRDSIFQIGLFSNKMVYLGVGLIFILQLAFIYLPFMNLLFRSAPLGPAGLAKAVLAGVLILPAIAAEKWFRRRLKAEAA